MLKLIASNEIWKDDAKAAHYSRDKIVQMRDGLLKLRSDVDECVIVSELDEQEVFKSDIIILVHKLEGFITATDLVIMPLTVVEEIHDLLDWGQELIGESVEGEIN